MSAEANTPAAAGPQGKTAVVTGASSGIGAVFARRLAEQGYNLLLVARREPRLRELCEQLHALHHVKADYLAADLTVPQALAKTAERVAAIADLELLVNNAGFGVEGHFAAADLASHLDMIRLHVVASVWLTRAALPAMLARRSGAVIHVSSIAGFGAMPGATTYCATKGYLITFSEALAAEVKPAGVRVQALCPGFTYTEFHDTVGMKGFDRAEVPKRLWTDAEFVVDASLAALRRGRVICIPGFRNRILARILAARWLRPLIAAVAARRDKKSGTPPQ